MESTSPLNLPLFPEFSKGWLLRFHPWFVFYKPNHKVFIETKSYTLKTATSFKELIEVFKLRYSIFLENQEALPAAGKIDFDEFDSKADHLIILCKQSKKIIGTYRLISSTWSEDFYSEGEFDLDDFLSTPGEKLELGRACIHSAYRNGSVLDLLWKGVASYMKLTGAQFLFGCSSIKGLDTLVGQDILSFYRDQGKWSDDYKIRSIDEFKLEVDLWAEAPDDSVKENIPPLLRSYLTAGARIHGMPAIDTEFHCLDFLTVLNLEEMSRSFKRRYF